MDINHVFHLAALDPDLSSPETLEKDLSRIKELFSDLQLVDTAGLEPLYWLSEFSHLRPDLASGELSQKQVLLNAPQATEEFFQLPKNLRTPSEE